jgi:hypothetical protein
VITGCATLPPGSRTFPSKSRSLGKTGSRVAHGDAKCGSCGTLRRSDPFRHAAHGMAGQLGAPRQSVSSSEPRMRRVTVMGTPLTVENLNEVDERQARSSFVDGCRGVRNCPNRQNRW